MSEPTFEPSREASAATASAGSAATEGSAGSASHKRFEAGRWAAIAAAVVGLIAIASLGIAWRTDKRIAFLEQELVRRQQESAQHATEARLLARKAEEGALDAAAKVALVEARLAETATQRTQLEDLIQSLSRSRDENLLVDIEAAIRVAMQQAAITGSVEPLVATLKQSDERLASYDQPRLAGVRRAIGRDLERVKAVGVADLASLAARLDEAIRLVDEMPLVAGADVLRERSAEVTAGAPSPTVASAPSALSNSGWWPQSVAAAASDALERIWTEAKSLVRVTRIDRPEAMLVAPEQAFFLKENLKLRLLNARLAVLSRQFTTAQSDVGAAQAAVERYFDRTSRRTQLVADLLRQVAGSARASSFPRPDDTLAAISAATAVR